MPRPPKEETTGITPTDMQEMRRIWDANALPRFTHRFKWNAAMNRWELLHQPSNTVKAYRNDDSGGNWIEV
jgi:hypothetical protein